MLVIGEWLARDLRRLGWLKQFVAIAPATFGSPLVLRAAAGSVRYSRGSRSRIEINLRLAHAYHVRGLVLRVRHQYQRAVATV